MESFISYTLLTLALFCGLAVASTSPWAQPARAGADLPADEPVPATRPSLLKAQRNLKASYLVVYALVMFADWLQGSYIFSLYHDQYGLSLHLVSLLFVLGFATAAVAAFAVGRWADAYGRKRMCLVFAVCYTLSCAVKFSPFLPTLFLGRLLGGFATAILFSSFESWLVSAAHAPDVALPAPELGRLLGRLTLASSVAAVASGFVADGVVARTGSYASPFGVSGACLVAAGAVIWPAWKENYGREGGGEGLGGLGEALRVLVRNPSLVMLVFVNTVVETTMYLWVAMWVPSLQDTLSPGEPALPLGRVFSSFMAAMSLGSLLYNAALYRFGPRSILVPVPDETSSAAAGAGERQALLATDASASAPSPGPAARTVAFHASLGCALLVLSGISNILSAYTGSTRTRFLCFLAFEGSLGLYYPVVANLRAALIPDSHRATLTALFRVPFNVLVTLALVLGLESHRKGFLVVSGGALLVAAAVAGRIARRAGGCDVKLA